MNADATLPLPPDTQRSPQKVCVDSLLSLGNTERLDLVVRSCRHPACGQAYFCHLAGLSGRLSGTWRGTEWDFGAIPVR